MNRPMRRRPPRKVARIRRARDATNRGRKADGNATATGRANETAIGRRAESSVRPVTASVGVRRMAVRAAKASEVRVVVRVRARGSMIVAARRRDRMSCVS